MLSRLEVFLAVLNTMLIAIAKCKSNRASIVVASSIEFRELFEYFMNNDPTSLFDELIIQGSHGRIMSRLTVVVMMVGKNRLLGLFLEVTDNSLVHPEYMFITFAVR